MIDSLENKIIILNNFLKICPFDGWNIISLKQAAQDSKIDENYISLIFDNGINDMTNFFNKYYDDMMEKEIKGLNLQEMKIRDKIKNSVKIRLKLYKNHKSSIKRLIEFYSNPKNTNLAIANCYKTVDTIWYAIGDQSTDFNFYSKRIILLKIYIRTILKFVQDDSDDHLKTYNFLDNQIEEVMTINKIKIKVKNCINSAQDLSKKLDDMKIEFTKSPNNLLKKIPFVRLYY